MGDVCRPGEMVRYVKTIATPFDRAPGEISLRRAVSVFSLVTCHVSPLIVDLCASSQKHTSRRAISAAESLPQSMLTVPL